MTQSHRTRLENSCILLLFLFSLGMFLFSFLHHSPAEAALLIGTEMDRMVQRALSLVLICLCHQLKKRKRAALDTALVLFLLNIVRSFPQLTRPRHLISGLVSLLLFLLFFHFRSDFCCPGIQSRPEKRILHPPSQFSWRDRQCCHQLSLSEPAPRHWKSYHSEQPDGKPVHSFRKRKHTICPSQRQNPGTDAFLV